MLADNMATALAKKVEAQEVLQMIKTTTPPPVPTPTTTEPPQLYPSGGLSRDSLDPPFPSPNAGFAGYSQNRMLAIINDYERMKSEIASVNSNIMSLKSMAEHLQQHISREVHQVHQNIEQRIAKAESIVQLEKTAAVQMASADWRIALGKPLPIVRVSGHNIAIGEFSMSLRRELATKLSREDVDQVVNTELQSTAQRLEVGSVLWLIKRY